MVNSNLPIPLHVQISKELKEQIKLGAYEERIPSERELIDKFSVSRTTIREAVSNLVREGILKKVHGKGTFINQGPPIQEWLSNLNSFTETVKRMGMEPGSKLLNTGILEKGKHDIDVLDGDIFTIERLRYADGVPVAIEKHYYSLAVGLQLTDFNLEKETIYDLLENELGIPLMEAEQFISAIEIDEKNATYLQIPEKSMAFRVERMITDSVEEPVEFYIGIYRPDMYQFRVKARRHTNLK